MFNYPSEIVLFGKKIMLEKDMGINLLNIIDLPKNQFALIIQQNIFHEIWMQQKRKGRHKHNCFSVKLRENYIIIKKHYMWISLYCRHAV